MTCKCDHGCKHESLNYCDKCGKVHCLKCGREWPQYEFIQPYIPYYPPVFLPSVWEPHITSGDSITTVFPPTSAGAYWWDGGK